MPNAKQPPPSARMVVGVDQARQEPAAVSDHLSAWNCLFAKNAAVDPE